MPVGSVFGWRAAPRRRAILPCEEPPHAVRGGPHTPFAWLAGLLLPVTLLAGGANGVENVPDNDSCTNATTVATAPLNDAVLTTGATSDASDPSPPCGNASSSNSVWYRLTANEAVTVTVTTLGSDYDTILSVYEGPCDRLASLPDACNDDDPRDGAQSTVSFAATAGRTYSVMVSAFDGDGGDLIFALNLRRAPLCVGDCDGDRAVTSSECDLCGEIRDGDPLALCPACDGDGDGQVAGREVNQCLLGIEDCIPCIGDCDGNGTVTASDLVTATSIIAHCSCTSGPGGTAIGCPALPTTVASCVAADRNGDGCVSVEELELLPASIFQCSPE